ncbi:hypothetical protein [Ruegeria atlantica]|uniref:hypothetical protein n=1 Tax=Ruegeria atlantica TaxID=81569 RepID=UPI0014816C84|nr:hypothetical protein [Ruegeria atlantica]
MQFQHERFTMSFRQALDYGIDYRTFKKVPRLPNGIPLFAVAGVWGEYSDIRCLFFDAQSNRYLRYIQKWGQKGFLIRELEMDATDLSVGLVVTV